MCSLPALLRWVLPVLAWVGVLGPAAAQEGSGRDWVTGISETVNGVAGPLADWSEKVVFFKVGQAEVIVLLLGLTGLFLTIYFGFINLRAFGLAVRTTRGKYTRPGAPGEISHFQALSAALSATVGLGNIAGVATAIGIGGPGAAFWMIVMGFLGMSSKFAECTLGVRYRKIDQHGKVHGGAMYYLTRGLAEKGPGWGKFGMVLAVLFAVFTVGGAIGAGNMYQINEAHSIVSSTFGVMQDSGGKVLFGSLAALLVAAVILGGIKSIGRVAELLVPLMCLTYILACLGVLVHHAGAVPGALAQIVTLAFAPQAVVGGIIGGIIQGVRRATFSNEAGLGSAPIAHSAVKTDKPASEGVVGLLEPFVDTVVVCTMTALVVIVTGQWKVDAKTTVDGVGLHVVSHAQRLDEQGVARPDREVLPRSEVLATVPLDAAFRIIGSPVTVDGDPVRAGEQAAKWGRVYPEADAVAMLGERVPGLAVVEGDHAGLDGVKQHFALPNPADGGALEPVEVWLPYAQPDAGGQMQTVVADHSKILKTKVAFGSVFPWFPAVLAVSVFLFAFSTQLSWGYYGEQAVLFLAGGVYRPKLVVGYKIFFCLCVVLGCILSVDKVLSLSDAMYFLMAVPNLIGVYLLLPRVRESLKDFLAHARAIDRGEKTREEI